MIVWAELHLLSDILKKHGAEGEEEVGQAQFAEVLQSVLHELADTLAEKRIVVTHNVKVFNGSKIRKVIACPLVQYIISRCLIQMQKTSVLLHSYYLLFHVSYDMICSKNMKLLDSS